MEELILLGFIMVVVLTSLTYKVRSQKHRIKALIKTNKFYLQVISDLKKKLNIDD